MPRVPVIRALTQRLVSSHEMRRLVSQSSPLYVAGAISILLTLAQQLVTARYLGVADFGRLATGIGYVTLAILFVDVRTWELGTRVLAVPLDDGDHQEVSRMFTWLLLGEVVIGLVGIAAVLALASVIDDLVNTELTDLLVVLAFLLPLRQVATGVSPALLRMVDAFRILSVRSVATALVRLLFIGGPAVAGLGPRAVAWGVVAAELFGAISAVALAAVVFRSTTGHSVFDRHRPAGLAAACRFAPKLWVSATIKGMQLETFIPVAAAFTTPAQVGVLRAGLDVAQVANLGTAPVAMVTSPRITALAQTDQGDGLRALLDLSSRALTAVAGVLAALGAVGAWVLLPTVLGEGFESVRIVAVLILASTAYQAAKQWVRPLLVGLDRVSAQSRLGLVAGVISLIALGPLASAFGAVGAAIDMSLFLVVYTTLSARIARRALADAS